jgi:hypothetical protein
MKHYVIESENEYQLLKIWEVGSHVYTKVIGTYKSLDLALENANIMNEDAIPVNSVSGGNVSGFSPIMKFRAMARRKLKTKFEGK